MAQYRIGDRVIVASAPEQAAMQLLYERTPAPKEPLSFDVVDVKTGVSTYVEVMDQLRVTPDMAELRCCECLETVKPADMKAHLATHGIVEHDEFRHLLTHFDVRVPGERDWSDYIGDQDFYLSEDPWETSGLDVGVAGRTTKRRDSRQEKTVDIDSLSDGAFARLLQRLKRRSSGTGVPNRRTPIPRSPGFGQMEDVE